jgi:hypothetical protein
MKIHTHYITPAVALPMMRRMVLAAIVVLLAASVGTLYALGR